MTTIRRLTSVGITLLVSVLILFACVGQAYAAEGDLQFAGIAGDNVAGSTTDGYTLYVRDGEEVEFTLSMVNATDGELDYVNMVESATYDAADGQAVNHFSFPGKAYLDNNETLTNAATNAVWGQGAELVTNYEGIVFDGYTIAGGATATVKMGFDAGTLPIGEHNLSFTIGKKCEHYNYVLYSDGARYWEPTGQITVIDEYVTIPITVIVYAQDGAKLSIGTGSPSNVAQISEDEPYDIGTFDITGSNLTGSETFYVVNTSEAAQMQGQPGSTTSIRVKLALDSASPETTPFTSENDQSQWQDLAAGENLSFDVPFDTSNCIAGTYTGYLVATTVPRSVSVNGGEANASGVYRFPIQITLTGEQNPNLDARVNDLAAEAGNGLVELTWTPAETASSGEYKVYRHRLEGTETQTDPDQLDWSLYQQVGSVSVNGQETLRYADGTAENGTTYAYTVLTGGPYHGYAAAPVIATPSASATLRVLAPMDGWNDYVSAADEEGGVYVGWKMNIAYGGDSCDGAGIVDHFNVYRDGVLVRQVYQNAVSRKGEGTDSEPYEYSWGAFVEVPELYVSYSWNVSAVSVTGVEGPLSGDAPYGENKAGGYALERPVIVGYNAEYESGEGLSIGIDHYIGPNRYGATLLFWRAEGASAPSTASTPLATVQSEVNTYSSYRDPDFVDTAVAANKTYTYTVRATDSDLNASEDYTFTVYTKSGRAYSTDVSWSVNEGKTPTARFYVPDSGAVAKVYRNDTLVKTINYNDGDYQSYSDTPTEDGTYTYRVDFYYSTGGITTTGRTFTFVRDSNAESDMLKPPDAPSITSRLSAGNVVLNWTPAETGGTPDGWYVYRRDAGQFVNGWYKYQAGVYNAWYETTWGNDRYLVIKDSSKHALVDTQSSSNYNGQDMTEGRLSGISWSEEACPHEWWVCAYNEAGVSAPSRIVTYSALGVDDYNNPILPANEDNVAPGTPVIDDVWVDWEDSSSSSSWDSIIGGYVRVAWSDPNPGGGIDQWNIGAKGTVYHQDQAVVDTLTYGDALLDPGLKSGGMNLSGASVNALPQSNSSGDYERTVEVTVSAQNSKGTSSVDTASIVVRSLPRFCVLPSNGAAVLRWTDLFQDTTTNVTGWEIWRKDPYGVWTKLDAPSSFEYSNAGSTDAVKYYQYTDDGLVNDYAYEYKVVAKCADGVDRPSVVRTVTPERTAAAEAPGAPRNLEANKVNGVIVLSWDEPESGGAPGYYQVMAKRDGGAWYYCQEVSGDSTSAAYTPNEAGDYEFFVWSYSYIGNERMPWYPDDEQDYSAYTTASNIATVTLSSEDISQQATSAPGGFSLTAVPGDHQVVLNWTASAGATYYVIERRNSDYPHMPDVTVAATGQASYSFTDEDALPGVRYRYIVTAYNGNGGVYSDVYATATGTTADAFAAETVEGLIAGLPAPADVTADDLEQIMSVQEAWDGLTAKQKSLVDETLAQKLTDCVSAAEEIRLNEQYASLVAPVQALIDDLPGETAVTLESKQQIQDARAAYDALSPAEAKRLVKTARLEAAERALAALEQAAADQAAADEADGLIAELPVLDNLTLADKATVEAARAAYEALTDDQKALVTKLDLLEAAEAKIAELQHEADVEAAGQWDGVIDGLPTLNGLTLADKATVEAARAAYEALTDDQKALVTKLDLLESAEAKIADLVADAAAQEEADDVIALIDAIGTVSPDSEAAIDAARQAYDAASERAQAKVRDVGELAVLQEAEGQLKAFKDQAAADAVIAKINALPDDESELTIDSRAAIDEALEAYENLTDDQKTLVGDSLHEKLASADARVSELEREAAEAARIDIAVGKLTLSGNSFVYDGKAKKPRVNIAVNDNVLVEGTDFSVNYTNNVKAGTAKVTLTGINAYKGTKTLTFTIKKAGNPLKASGKTATVKASKVKKKAQSLKVSKVVKFSSKGAGTLSYKKKSGNKKIVINKKTGKVTVKKGLKKGTYKVKMTVRAVGNGNYNAKTINVTFKVKVK